MREPHKEIDVALWHVEYDSVLEAEEREFARHAKGLKGGGIGFT